MLSLEDHFDSLPDETKTLLIDVGANAAFKDILTWMIIQYNGFILALDPDSFETKDKFVEAYKDLIRYRSAIEDILAFLEKEHKWIEKIYGKQEKTDAEN